MRRSPFVHVIAVMVALTSTLVGLGLVVEGSGQVWQAFARLDFSMSSTTVGFLLQLAGIIFITVAALTGIWSSAGLITVSIIGLGALALSAMPLAAATLLQSVEVLSTHWYSALFSGLPQFVCLALGAMGFAVMLQRRAHPRSKRSSGGNGGVIAGHIVGIVLAPLLTVGGVVLTLRGIEANRIAALTYMESFTDPGANALIIGGAALFTVGVFLVRWSPFALLLPALITFVAAILIYASPNLPFTLIPSLIPFQVHVAAVLGVALIAGSVTFWSVRARSRRKPRHSS